MKPNPSLLFIRIDCTHQEFIFMLHSHTLEKHGDPVIRSPTEIQFLRRRRAKLRKNGQKSCGGDAHHKLDHLAAFSMYVHSYVL